MPTLELTIASGIDDSEVSSVSSNAVGSAKIAGGGFFQPTYRQALLFRGAAALAGATIHSATLRVTNSFFNFANFLTKLRAEAADNPDPLPDGTSIAEFLATPRTAAGVDWDVNNFEWQSEVPADSPDLATVVQEVVDRPGFGDRIHILWDDDGSESSPPNDLYHYDGDPLKAPKLIIDYTPAPPAPDSAQVTAGEAIVAALTAGSFSQEFTPIRSYAQWQRPFEVAEAVGLQVDIVPFSPMDDDLSSRGSIQYAPAIDIVIRRKFAAADLEEVPGENEARVKTPLVDALVALLEAINESLTARRIGGDDVVWKSNRILATYLPAHLRDKHQFTGVIRVTTEVVRELAVP